MKPTNFNVLIIFSLVSIIISGHHTKDEWKSRSVYQILTDRFSKDNNSDSTCSDLSKYCGGTFNGIKNHLDYIKGMGFDAIWISPPLKNKEGSFHGYHNIDLYSINEHFGSAQELKDLITECHNKDIWVILDAVPNHMAGDLDISTFIPFNKTEHYHIDIPGLNCSEWDDSNQSYVENCSIWGMPDLAQENTYVKETLISWLKTMIDLYDFDGIRYADVRNVPKWFWAEFTEAANTYTLGIVSSSETSYIADYQKYMDGAGDYPLFNVMRKTFCNESFSSLSNYIKNNHTSYLYPEYNGIWFSNHDNARFLYGCNNRNGFINGIIFTLFYEGIPIFYYGDEQYFKGGNDPNNREVLFNQYNNNSDLYQTVKVANNIRKSYKIYDNDFKEVYVDDNFYVFTRGNVLIAVSNGKTGDITLTGHGYNNGERLCNQLGDKECINVVYPELKIEMDGQPKIFVKSTSSNGNKFIGLSILYLLICVAFLF